MTLIKNKAFYQSMLSLAVPIALQNMLSTCANLVDIAMVSRLGNATVAAVGIAGRWSFFISMLFFGLASGSSVLISQYWGAKDHESIRKTYGMGLICGLTLAAVYTVVSLMFPRQMMMLFTNEAEVIALGAKYIRIYAVGMLPQAYSFINAIVRRATEDVLVPFCAAAAAVFTNTFLNYCLIYGNFGFPEMGIEGAALATAISFYVQLVFYVIISLRQRHFTVVAPRQLLDLKKTFVQAYFRIASPVLLNEFCWVMASNIYSMIYARQGSENYAAFTVYNSVQELSFIFFVGICNACAIMLGKTVGCGKTKEAYALGKTFLMITPILGVVVGALLILVRNPVLGLMQLETEHARQTASNLVLFYGLWLPFRNIPYTAVVGIFRAGGDIKMSFFLDVGTMYFFSIPTVLLLAFVFKVPFIWLVIGMYLSEDLIKSVICLRHFVTRRWIRQLTRTGECPLPDLPDAPT